MQSEEQMRENTVICTFGDLIRVPGTEMSLAGARAKGAELKAVYSPMDALKLAEENPEKQVIFLSVGFETTVPGSCLAVKKAKSHDIRSVLLLAFPRCKTVPALLTAPYAHLPVQNRRNSWHCPVPWDMR